MDAFSSNRLRRNRERLAQEAVRESQDTGRDTDRVFGEPELPQQSSKTSEHEPNVAPVSEQPDVSMPDPESPETPDDPAEAFDDDHDEQTTADPVPHSSSSHGEPRPEYKVPPPEPDDPVATRRRVVAQRLATAAEEEKFRQKRMKSESVPGIV